MLFIGRTRSGKVYKGTHVPQQLEGYVKRKPDETTNGSEPSNPPSKRTRADGYGAEEIQIAGFNEELSLQNWKSSETPKKLAFGAGFNNAGQPFKRDQAVFPPSVTRVTFGDKFNQQLVPGMWGTETIIEEIYFGGGFNNAGKAFTPGQAVFPPSVRTVNFGGFGESKFNQQLVPGMWGTEPRINNVYFGGEFNNAGQPFTPGQAVFPPSVRAVNFGGFGQASFNQQLVPGMWATAAAENSLEEINFGRAFNNGGSAFREEDGQVFPDVTGVMELGNSFNQQLVPGIWGAAKTREVLFSSAFNNGGLPFEGKDGQTRQPVFPKVKNMDLGANFNQQLVPGIWDEVESVLFGDRFNNNGHPFNPHETLFPENLVEVIFGQDFDQQLVPGMWGKNQTGVYFGKNFSNGGFSFFPGENVLPPKLEVLSLENCENRKAMLSGLQKSLSMLEAEEIELDRDIQLPRPPLPEEDAQKVLDAIGTFRTLGTLFKDGTGENGWPSFWQNLENFFPQKTFLKKFREGVEQVVERGGFISSLIRSEYQLGVTQNDIRNVRNMKIYRWPRINSMIHRYLQKTLLQGQAGCKLPLAEEKKNSRAEEKENCGFHSADQGYLGICYSLSVISFFQNDREILERYLPKAKGGRVGENEETEFCPPLQQLYAFFHSVYETGVCPQIPEFLRTLTVGKKSSLSDGGDNSGLLFAILNTFSILSKPEQGGPMIFCRDLVERWKENMVSDRQQLQLALAGVLEDFMANGAPGLGVFAVVFEPYVVTESLLFEWIGKVAHESGGQALRGFFVIFESKDENGTEYHVVSANMCYHQNNQDGHPEKIPEIFFCNTWKTGSCITYEEMEQDLLRGGGSYAVKSIMFVLFK